MTDPAALRAALEGRYELVRELGAGGMATVWLARDVRHDRQVAVKVLRADVAAALGNERFLAEIKTTARLQHSQILPLLDSGEAGGHLFYVMPFVDGETLRTRLTRGSVENAEGVGILRDVARALAYAHKHGVVHRDIKPENVLLSDGSAVVADFGIAKAIDVARTQPGTSLTSVGTALGTPAYMAPEQALGDTVDARTDVYAWGVLAYEVLSGAHPFVGRTTAQALVAAHVNEVPTPLETAGATSPDLQALVMHCLAKRADDRPESAGLIVAALDGQVTPSEGRASPRVPAAAAMTRLSPSRRGLYAVGLVVLLGIGTTLAYLWFGAGNPTPGGAVAIAADADTASPSLVVLPFTNTGGVQENEIFADGVTEDVIAHLASASGLTVISRTSAMTYKGSTKSLKEIARELGVTTVLEGSVRRSGSRVRVVAQLIDARTDANRWSGTFDRELVDVFTIQSEVAQAIADTLRATLGPAARRLMSSAQTRDTLAYQLFLQARASYAERSDAGMHRAIALAQQALARDSTFAPAWALLAATYVAFPIQSSSYSSLEWFPKARGALTRALALEPELTDARATLGMLRMLGDHDWEGAEREFERAMVAGHGNAQVRRLRGSLFSLTHRDSAALAEAREALRLDPESATNLQSVGGTHITARRYDEALAVLRRAAPLARDFRLIWANRYQAAWQAGYMDEAIESLNQAARVEGGPGIDPAAARAAFARGGKPALARLLLDHFQSPYAVRYEAQWHTVVGEYDAAMENLERRYAANDGALPYVLRWEQSDPLRDMPRFRRLLQRMRMTP